MRIKFNGRFLISILFVFLSLIFLFQDKGYCAVWPKAHSLSKSLSNPQTKTKTQSKTNITSDSLVVNNKKHIAVFMGHVVAIKGKLKILSSKLDVVYNKKNKVKKLIAVGNVHIIKGKDNITGGRAVYYEEKKFAIITENPVAYEGKNKISGKEIKINFKTGISTVIGGKKRVNAVIYSNKSLKVEKSSAKTNKTGGKNNGSKNKDKK